MLFWTWGLAPQEQMKIAPSSKRRSCQKEIIAADEVEKASSNLVGRRGHDDYSIFHWRV
jgi:hypothetical protein